MEEPRQDRPDRPDRQDYPDRQDHQDRQDNDVQDDEPIRIARLHTDRRVRVPLPEGGPRPWPAPARYLWMVFLLVYGAIMVFDWVSWLALDGQNIGKNPGAVVTFGAKIPWVVIYGLLIWVTAARIKPFRPAPPLPPVEEVVLQRQDVLKRDGRFNAYGEATEDERSTWISAEQTAQHSAPPAGAQPRPADPEPANPAQPRASAHSQTETPGHPLEERPGGVDP